MSWRSVFVTAVGLLMGACEPQNSDDLQRWMNDVRQRHHSVPIKMPTAATVTAFSYQAADHPDPFDLGKLSVLEAATTKNAPQPDLRRPREPLESIPLDSLRLIGHLRRGKEVVALIQADRLIYSIRIGNYLGQDLGKVTAIHEKAIDIEEWLADSTGRWVRRQTQLMLQEKK